MLSASHNFKNENFNDSWVGDLPPFGATALQWLQRGSHSSSQLYCYISGNFERTLMMSMSQNLKLEISVMRGSGVGGRVGGFAPLFRHCCSVAAYRFTFIQGQFDVNFFGIFGANFDVAGK